MSQNDLTLQEQADIFGVLSDPTRLKILKLLSLQNQPDALCVNALAHILGITQSAVSQHLRILKAAGMVKNEKRGYRVHYFLNRQKLAYYREITGTVLGGDELDLK